MEVNTLEVITRTALKKSASKQTRKQGNIPAVVYGHTSPRHIVVSEREFEKKFHKVPENTIISLMENDKKICDVLIKTYQEDLRTESIKHIDFYEIESGKLLKTRIPVVVTGNSVGVKAGGVLQQLVHEIDVECLPVDIPEKFVINIDSLEIGDSIHLKDIEKSDKVKFTGIEDSVILHVVHPKAIVEPEEAVEEEGEEGAEAAAAEADKEE
ncbi:MAG: 50S ribosomal protein L25 [Spirochaetia bacterium]|jgi:large subunit ribosomal protein L25|nr:50S ribosomal protein L25 [Spirochaetia bacterium]